MSSEASKDLDADRNGSGNSNQPHAVPRASKLSLISPKSIGAVYVWILLIVIFSAWIPHVFVSYTTFSTIADENSISAIAALAVLIPLAAGTFDLSIGSVMGFAGVCAGRLLSSGSINAYVVVVLVLLLCALVGLVNAVVVVRFKVDSFIGTLATGSIIAAVTLGISGEQILTSHLYGSFSQIATASFHQIQASFLYALIIAALIYWLLSRTVFGRRVYAVGYNPEASRLAGIAVNQVRTISLITSATLAGFAGILLAASVEAADPSAGPSYLIPAFSAAFLGATQYRRGRFNPQWTLVAIFMLGTASTGLLLAGAPQWSPQLFQGVVLIFAVGLTVNEKRSPARRRRSEGPSQETGTPSPARAPEVLSSGQVAQSVTATKKA